MAREQFQARLTDTEAIVRARNAKLAKAAQPRKAKVDKVTPQALQTALDALDRCGATVGAGVKPYRRGT